MIAAEDPMLQAILAAGTRWLTIFGKSWDLHVTEGLKTSLGENLAMIGDTIEYLRSSGRRVIYDAEHWFDGVQAQSGLCDQDLEAATLGAEWLVLATPTVAPTEISQIVRDVVGATPHATQLGIHTHDSDTAVANALAAVMEGAKMVKATINGYGERCGNANLALYSQFNSARLHLYSGQTTS